MKKQGWVWPRGEDVIDVFVARAGGEFPRYISFNLRQANASFPDVSLFMPAHAKFGFARLERTGNAWLISPDYQVGFTMHGQAWKGAPGDDVALDLARESATIKEFALADAYPNPFNPTTTIRFELPESAPVRLAVYDLLGREVQILVDGNREAGVHEVVFEASTLPSGTYVYRLETPAGAFSKKMLLLK